MSFLELLPNIVTEAVSIEIVCQMFFFCLSAFMAPVVFIGCSSLTICRVADKKKSKLCGCLPAMSAVATELRTFEEHHPHYPDEWVVMELKDEIDACSEEGPYIVLHWESGWKTWKLA